MSSGVKAEPGRGIAWGLSTAGSSTAWPWSLSTTRKPGLFHCVIIAFYGSAEGHLHCHEGIALPQCQPATLEQVIEKPNSPSSKAKKGSCFVYWTKSRRFPFLMLSAIRKKNIAHVQALNSLSFSEVNTSLGFFSLKFSQPSDVIIS